MFNILLVSGQLKRHKPLKLGHGFATEEFGCGSYCMDWYSWIPQVICSGPLVCEVEVKKSEDQSSQ